MRVERALVSVSDRTGLAELGRGLAAAGVEIVSSGGTAAALDEAGVPVTSVAEITGAPEILGGRVKTLHPKIHGGILADRHNPAHMAELERQGIAPIDLVVCNLYPFERTIADPAVALDDAIEQIDIGGPAMVRAAAKNFASVAVVVSPSRYAEVVDALRMGGGVPDDLRRELAVEALSLTASYDALIVSYLRGPEPRFPERLVFDAPKVADLRYGENPHQEAAFYRLACARHGLAAARQLHGKQLSYNNLLDSDAAWRLVWELEPPAAVIVKHLNPCGAAEAESLADAFTGAFDCDRTSAFGGIVALNRPCDEATAARIAEIFTEVVLAPSFDEDALARLTAKKNVRLLEVDAEEGAAIEVRSVAGGILAQSSDGPDRLDAASSASAAKVVTSAQPSQEQWADLRFAWTVAKHVRSNAIVLARDRMAVGVGAGQMNRVESTQLAARRAGERAAGSVCASDAFFPFRDGVDAAAEAGAVAIVQPGGSVRDDEVIAAADEHGLPMVFTGRRHFRH